LKTTLVFAATMVSLAYLLDLTGLSRSPHVGVFFLLMGIAPLLLMWLLFSERATFGQLFPVLLISAGITAMLGYLSSRSWGPLLANLAATASSGPLTYAVFYGVFAGLLVCACGLMAWAFVGVLGQTFGWETDGYA
jgi:hypothetical protein